MKTTSSTLPIRKSVHSCFDRQEWLRSYPEHMSIYKAIQLLLLLVICSASAIAAPQDKPTVSQFVFTRTWPNGFSEIEWWQDGRRQRAITNIDCSKLASFLFVENTTTKFDLMNIGSTLSQEEIASLQQTGAVDANGFPQDWPRTLPQRFGAAQYVIGADGKAEFDSATLWLNALHRYYDLHRAEIVAAWQERERQKPLLEAAALEREQRLRDEAKAPPTQVRVMSIEGRPPNLDSARRPYGTKK